MRPQCIYILLLLVPFMCVNALAQDYPVDTIIAQHDNHPGGSIVVENISGYSCQLRAVPNPGYSFKQWADDNNNTIPNPRPYTQVKSEQADCEIWAVFARNEDCNLIGGTIDVTVDNPSVPSFFLHIIPAEHYQFYKWDNGSENTTISYLENDGTRYPYLIGDVGQVIFTYNNHVGGIVQAQNVNGLHYNLVATANSGYTFQQWADGNTQNPRPYTHGGNEHVDEMAFAVFTKDEDMTSNGGDITVSVKDEHIPSYQLTINLNEGVDFYKWDNGESTTTIDYLESDGNRYPYFLSGVGTMIFDYVNHVGGTVQAQNINGLHYDLVATASSGYSFLQWADGNTLNPRPYVHGGDEHVDEVAFAVFTKDEDMTSNGGEISVSINDEHIPSYQLTINLNEGVDFYKWDNGESTTTIDYLESDGNRYPFFLSVGGILTFDFVQHPGGVVSVDNVSGLNLDLVATANSGYSFQQWADGNTQNPRSYTHGGDELNDEVAYAVFTRTQDVTQLDGTTTVEVDDSSIPSFTLTATESSCAGFVRWVSGEEEATISYQESDGTKIPLFTYGDHQILLEYDNQEGGIVTATPHTCGFTLNATPTAGWHFSHWTDDASLAAERDVDYVANTYTAIFSLSAFKVGTTFYPTFDAAETAAVGAGLPIELVDDVTDNLIVSQDVQIDGNNHIVGSLTIPLGKKLTLTDDLRVNNLYLQTTTASSSQLVNKEHLTCTNAYMDITLEASQAEASPDKWYAFSVPFEVDVANGIRRANAPEAACTSTTDYLVWEYDGTLRAATGNGWVKMYGGTLEPGKFYMIGIDGTQNTWRFAKKSGSALGGSNVVDLPAFTGSIIDRGWNAIGNGTLQYATASIPDIAFVQVYDNNMSTYLPKMLNATSFVVACPFFAQVEGANTMTLSASNETNPAALYAPRRMAMQEKNIYEVRLSKDDNYDVLFISANDESSESYQIGKDVLKLGLNTSRPQLFTMNAGTMLCVEDRPFVNGAADFPIYILAPQAGDYELTVSDGNRSVYLLENGMPIAEITGMTYTLRLSRGMAMNYSLRIGERHEITTGIDAPQGENHIQKIIYNNQLYIIHNDKVYNANGVLMR